MYSIFIRDMISGFISRRRSNNILQPLIHPAPITPTGEFSISLGVQRCIPELPRSVTVRVQCTLNCTPLCSSPDA